MLQSGVTRHRAPRSVYETEGAIRAMQIDGSDIHLLATQQTLIVRLPSFDWDFRLGSVVTLGTSEGRISARQLGFGIHEGRATLQLGPLGSWTEAALFVARLQRGAEPVGILHCPGVERLMSPTPSSAKPYTAMAAAWKTAAEDLGVLFLSPFSFVGRNGAEYSCSGLLPHFGGPRGALIVSRDDKTPDADVAGHRLGFFTSALSPFHYEQYVRDSFVETLSDWGWYGPAELRPGWVAKEGARVEALLDKEKAVRLLQAPPRAPAGGLLTDVSLEEDLARLRGKDAGPAEHVRHARYLQLVELATADASRLAMLVGVLEEEPDRSLATSLFATLLSSEKLPQESFEHLAAIPLVAGRLGHLVVRMQLLRRMAKGIGAREIADAVASQDAAVQRVLLASPQCTSAGLEALAGHGANKAIRNQAEQLLRRRP